MKGIASTRPCEGLVNYMSVLVESVLLVKRRSRSGGYWDVKRREFWLWILMKLLSMGEGISKPVGGHHEILCNISLHSCIIANL